MGEYCIKYNMEKISLEDYMQNRNDKSLFGADINEYTQNANFAILATSVDFLYLRASGSSSGRFRTDKRFIKYAEQCRNYGIPCGAYHYAVPSADVTTADVQCDNFIDTLQKGFGEGNYGDIFPVVDVEAPINKSITTVQLLNWVDRFRRRFREKTRRTLMLYTGAFFIDLYDNFYYPGRGYILADMPLWIAMYTSIPGNPPYPEDAGGWTRWRIWQFSESGRINGATSPTDLNWGPNRLSLLSPPQKVKGLTAVRSGNTITVRWNRSNEPDISGYNLYLNSRYAGSASKNADTYTIDASRFNIPAGVPLVVSIEAYDLDNDFSQERATANVKDMRTLIL